MRIPWVDVAKGMGILAVFLGHLVQYGSPLFAWIFSFHMPLFFFLAGVTHTCGQTDGWHSLKKVFASLLLPYILFSLVGLLFSLIIPGWFPESCVMTLYDVFYIVQPESLHVGQLWFLFSLAVVQFLMIVVGTLSSGSQKKEFAGCVILAATAIAVSCFDLHVEIAGYKLPLPFKLNTSCVALLFFYSGYRISKQTPFLRLMNARLPVKLLTLLFALSASYVFGPLLNGTVNLALSCYNNPLFFLLSSFSGILFILLVSSLAENSAALRFYGRNSLSIFACHSFLLYLFVYLISSLFSQTFILMRNIPGALCLAGLVFVSVLSIPIPALYANTLARVIADIKRMLGVI